MSPPSLRRAGLIVLAFAVAGKVVGLVREMVVAATYGTSQVVDIYLAAIAIPAVIATVLSQALPNAFVPLFVGTQKLQRQGRRHAGLLCGAMILLSLAVWFAASPLAALTSGGFSLPLQWEVTVILQIASLSIGLATIEAIGRSRLLAKKRFLQSGASGLWPSLAMIVALILHPEGGSRTLIWGLVTGGGVAALWNFLPLSRRPVVPTGENEQHAAKTSPSTGGGWIYAVIGVSATGALYILIDRYFGSFLAEGSIAALQYANLIASQSVAICGLALGTAVLPFLSEAFHRADSRVVGQIVDRAVRWALLGSIPAAVWLVFFGDEIVTVLFERGAFDADSRSLTGSILRIYGVWVVPAVLSSVVGRIFYAARRWQPTLLAVLAGVAVKFVLSLFLVGTWGVGGLAAASAAGALVGAAVLLILLPNISAAISRSGWLRYAAALLAVFSVGALGAEVAKSFTSGFNGMTHAVLQLSVGVGLGGGLLLAFGDRLGVYQVARFRVWLRSWR